MNYLLAIKWVQRAIAYCKANGIPLTGAVLLLIGAIGGFVAAGYIL